MSIETAAKDMAEELQRNDLVEILCHHDADGIAAGSIMSTALYRAHIPFRMRVTRRIKSTDLPSGHLLLCDLGSGLQDLPENTMVIDHHMSLFGGPFHVNPRLEGINGDTDLSAAGAAYIVANALGDNRDLAGLIMPGVIGDGQKLSGKNYEIYMEAIANGIIQKERGIRLAGRTIQEKLTLAVAPYIPGISGDEEATARLIDSCPGENGEPALDMLLSLLTLDIAPCSRADAMLNIYGDVYQLEREVVDDAHLMTLLIDSCGKEGAGGIASSLCLRSSKDIEKAYEIALSHRKKLLDELKTAYNSDQTENVRTYETGNLKIVSDLADTIWFCIDDDRPVLVLSKREEGQCLLSIRSPEGTANLGEVVSTLAEECGGFGGGHTSRAGATIACEQLNRFKSGIAELCQV